MVKKGMEIVVEIVFVNCFVFNFLLLSFTRRLTHTAGGNVRIALGSAFGAVISLLSPMMPLPIVFALPVKVLIACVTVFFVGRIVSAKKFFLCLVVLLALTFLLGGVMFALLFFLQGSFVLTSDFSIHTNIPLGIYIGGVSFFLFATKSLLGYFKQQKTMSGFVFDVVLRLDKEYAVKGYMDSGNLLTFGSQCLPVVVTASKYLQQQVLKFVALQVSQNQPLSFTNCMTAVGARQMMVVPCQIVFKSQTFSAMVGVGQSTDSNFDLLLNAQMLGGDQNETAQMD